MYPNHYENLETEDLRSWTVIGDDDLAASIYENGVVEPILVTDYRGARYLIAGNRRIIGLLAAYDRAAADGTLEARWWLSKVDARVFEEVPPDDQALISLIENEVRSSNIILEWQHIHQLQQSGRWNDYKKWLKMNKGREDKFLKLDNAHPELVQACLDGKLTTTTLIGAAGLPQPRQEYLLTILATKGKVVGTDIEKAKTAAANAVLSSASFLQQINVPAVNLSMKLVILGFDGGLLSTDIWTDLGPAHEFAVANGGKVYRLVEVK